MLLTFLVETVTRLKNVKQLKYDKHHKNKSQYRISYLINISYHLY